uniref:Uncharacterized protein n=1 Tax=Arundo donax TaxID=35708 RepID=A0A0A9CXD4_ARUDO
MVQCRETCYGVCLYVYLPNPNGDLLLLPPSPYCSFHFLSSFMLVASKATDGLTLAFAWRKSSNFSGLKKSFCATRISLLFFF